MCVSKSVCACFGTERWARFKLPGWRQLWHEPEHRVLHSQLQLLLLGQPLPAVSHENGTAADDLQLILLWWQPQRALGLFGRVSRQPFGRSITPISNTLSYPIYLGRDLSLAKRQRVLSQQPVRNQSKTNSTIAIPTKASHPKLTEPIHWQPSTFELRILPPSYAQDRPSCWQKHPLPL